MEGKFRIQSDVDLMQFHVVLCRFRRREVKKKKEGRSAGHIEDYGYWLPALRSVVQDLRN